VLSWRGNLLSRCDHACSESHWRDRGVFFRALALRALLENDENGARGLLEKRRITGNGVSDFFAANDNAHSHSGVRCADLANHVHAVFHPCGPDSLTRNAPLVLFRVGVCGRGSPVIRHPCRGGRPCWCEQSIQPWSRESQSPMVTAFLYLILHAPSDIRGTSKLVRMPSPWHLGMRRLTAHRPLGVEAPCRGLPSDVESRWRPARVRALRLDSRGCCPPVGRGSGGCAWYWPGHHLNTPRARPQAEHTTSWPSAISGRSSASCPTSPFGPKESEKIVLQRFFRGIWI